MVEAGEVIEISGYIPTITSVNEFLGDFAVVEAGEVIGTSSYPFTITSVDELVGNTGIKVGEFIEISGYIPTITSVDELVGDTGVEVGEFIEISGYIPTITSVDELVGGMARQLIARVSSSFQNLKQFSDSMRVFFIFWCLLDASFTISYSLISKRTTDTRKRSLFMIY